MRLSFRFNPIIWNLLIGVFFIALTGLAWGSAAEDESQVLYAEGQIAYQEGQFKDALLLAQKAYTLSPSNLKAAQLILDCAKALDDPELAKASEPKVEEARQRSQKVDQANAHLLEAQSEIKAGRREAAIQRLVEIENLGDTLRTDAPSLLNEARFRLGLAYLEDRKLDSAAEVLQKSGLEFGQQSLFLMGQIFSARGYPVEAYAAFLKASGGKFPNADPQVSKAALELARQIKATHWSGQVFVTGSLDTNAFGLPDETNNLYDGTPNRAITTNMGLSLAVTSGRRWDKPWALQGDFSFSESRALAPDSRRLLNLETFGPGVSFLYSKLGLGKFSFRYGFSLQRAPVGDDASYPLRLLQRDHDLSAQFSRELGEKLDFSTAYRARFAKFLTPSDLDTGDRSGVSHSGFFSLGYRSGSQLFYPTLGLSYGANFTHGDLYRSRNLGATLSNGLRIPGTSINTEAFVGYDRTGYWDFPGDRTDRSARAGVTASVPLFTSVSLSASTQFQRTFSDQAYYLRRRWLMSVGLTAGF